MGPVTLAGLTIDEAREKLRTELTRFLREPQVSLTLVDSPSRRFWVFGEVERPGIYPLERPLTALPTFGTTIHGARIRSVGFPQVADRSRVVWGSVECGEALVALGRGTRLVAAVSLNSHERLGRLAGWLRPGSAFDDPGREEQLLTTPFA